MLAYEEANILYALELSRANDWWEEATGLMQGLRTLYGQTGRRTEWKRLVAEVVPLIVDLSSETPLPGRENSWGLVTTYRVKLAREEHDVVLAETLHKPLLNWHRQRAAVATSKDAELSEEHKGNLDSLAVALETMGGIRREQGERDCVEFFEESISVFRRLKRPTREAIVYQNLGQAYLGLPAIRNLDQAETSFQRSLQLFQREDSIGRADSLRLLGQVANERALEALDKASRTSEQDQSHQLMQETVLKLNESISYYEQSLTILPPFATDRLVETYQRLALVMSQGRVIDRTIPHEAIISHSREAIRLAEAVNDFHRAAQSRLQIASTLMSVGKPEYLQEALLYANLGLEYLDSLGTSAKDDARHARELVEEIQRCIAEGYQPPT
jgi:tetratricopeptide (TPR) repeat protein